MRKILIADDEKAIRDVLARFLSLNGYAVSTSENGVDTIEKIKSGDFDILIIDWRMPLRKGCDVLAEIKKAKIEIPCLVLTGTLDAQDCDEFKKLGYGQNDILYKPADLFVILSKVKEKLPPQGK